jgi:hypothetical protein
MRRSVPADRFVGDGRHCNDEVSRWTNYGDSGHLLPVASGFVRSLCGRRASRPILARVLDRIASPLEPDVPAPRRIRDRRLTREKTVAVLGRTEWGASGVWARTLEGNEVAKESPGKTGMAQPEVLAGCRDQSNIFTMKCFGVCSREIRVCRSPTASGFAGNLRCLGVLGPMIRPAIADPRESDVLPPGRLRRAPGRSGRTTGGARNAATETRSAHEKTGARVAAPGPIENASSHPPPMALPPSGKNFWAGLVFRCARAVHGSAQLARVQPCSQDSGAAGWFAMQPSSVPTTQRCEPAGELGSPEPLQEALQTLLAGMARRRVRVLATEGETRHDRRQDPEHAL